MIKHIVSLTTFCLLFLSFNSNAQSVGINATGTAPDNSALLDLNATDKGFLITRVEPTNIVSPAFGLMTLAPSDSCLYMFSGMNWISLGGVGANCPCACAPTPPSPIPCAPDNTTQVVDVTNPTTGKTWMDRNLGASQVATSLTDASSYGDLYQWGRCADGHEKRNSGVTLTQSSTNIVGHGDFIQLASFPYDWRSTQNDNLWQGVSGVNNPCPSGYRLPTQAEFVAERASWISDNQAGAHNSPLKFNLPGMRRSFNASLSFVGDSGSFWSSTLDPNDAPNNRPMVMSLSSTSISIGNSSRGEGRSVRCIKN